LLLVLSATGATGAMGTMSAAVAQPQVNQGVLTDEGGMTLYIFDNDATVPGKSACTGSCLNMWTPLYAAPQAKAQGEYALIARDDGRMQWTHKGRPLYRWYADKKPGDKDGDGLRRAWHVAVP
jgi:predicted lipoprotein with Yx(FWY)xxD motif